MNYVYRKVRSLIYLGVNTVLIIFAFPFNKKSSINIKNNLKRDTIINFILNKKFSNQGHYLEIGCDLDQTFSKIINKNKIGIDPVRGGNLKLNSKDFFEDYNSQKFDMIFIDGSHLIEDVFYDTVQSIASLNLGGYVLLDDVLPNNYFNTFRKRITLHSFQDAYKILFLLMELKFIELYLIPHDHGMALFKLIDEPDFEKLKYDFSKIGFDNYLELLEDNRFSFINDFDELLNIN